MPECVIQGCRIRDLRTAGGLSQQTLATEAACSLSMVRLLEAGYQPRTSDILDRIVEVLSAPGNDGSRPAKAAPERTRDDPAQPEAY